MGRTKPTATTIPALGSQKFVKEPGQVTLALDMSMSCVGWVIGCEGNIILYGKTVFKRSASIGEKVIAFGELIESLLSLYNPTRLALERPDPRARTRNHFQLLGVVRLLWWRHCQKHILDTDMPPARTIKKHLHVDPAPKGDHKENKRRMVNKINTLYGLNLAFAPYSAYQSDDDIADAIAVLVTYWRLNGLHDND